MWALGRAGVDRRSLVLAACSCVRTVLPHLPPGEERPQRILARAEAWAHRRPHPADEGPPPQATDGITRPVLAAAYAAYGAATADLIVAASSARTAAQHTVAAATEAQIPRADARLADHIRRHRWPLSKARTHRWPAPALVAWDLLADRTTDVTDLSTVDVLCARSLLPDLDDDPRLRLQILRERLWLAPDLTDRVTALLAELP